MAMGQLGRLGQCFEIWFDCAHCSASSLREGSEEGRGADFEADLAMLAAVQAQLERQRSTGEARQG